MEKRERKGLVVRVLFEPSRIAANCLEDAYERIVPLARTVMRISPRAPDQPSKKPAPQASPSIT